jgi:3-deoxy-manno-octulosonate cytidylyltransferase (CMP-KDO synthetase)
METTSTRRAERNTRLVADKGIIGVIPARYGSTRFPGKPLALIAGRPMVQHVYERAQRARLLTDIVVATDDDRIRQAVENFGGRAVMTSQAHSTGTDRVAEIAGSTDAPLYVNIQGDEPLIDPAFIDKCAELISSGAQMSTLVSRIETRNHLLDQNVVKVVIDRSGHAIYFSRHAIPFPRKYLDAGRDVDLGASTYLRHVGVYGYTKDTLLTLAEAGRCEMEDLESLEQLRALYLGVRIRVGFVGAATPCVDVPEDIEAVERLIKAGKAEQ